MENNAKKKGWTSLSPVQFQESFAIVSANAQRHFDCAELLSAAGHPQNGIAHLILGSEELVKSFWCLLMGRKVDLRKLTWFTKLFYNHKVRHDLLKDFFTVYLFFFNSSLPKRKHSDGFLKIIGMVFGRSIAAYGNYRWWENADGMKQRAFYVDFADGFLDPGAITAADYTNALVYVKLFRNDLKQMVAKVDGSSDKQLQDLVDELQLFEIDRLRQEMYKELKVFKKSKNEQK
jgi:AbiV family abortive infection protein